MTRGSVRTINGRHYARARYGEGRQVEKVVPWATTPEEALAVAAIITDLAEQLAAANRVDMIDAMAKRIAATQDKSDIATVRAGIAAIVKGATHGIDARRIDFLEWARRWTSGELAREYPDHVRAKDASNDVSRIKRYIARHMEGVLIKDVTIAHGDLVMKKCPLTNPASRRQVAQIMHRVMALAVYPGRLIASNPFPRQWMPKLPKKQRRYFCLWPREEETFLRCSRVPFVFRLYCGVLAREGMREMELLTATWDQINLVEGAITVYHTKTGDPRMWVMSPDVTRALRMWRARNPTSKRPFAEVLARSKQRRGRKARGEVVLMARAERLAGIFRDALAAAGVERAELFVSTAYTGKIRIHDLRATFVTVSLAAGRSDTWIRDRTGHRTTSMLDRYRREARQYAELGMCQLAPLDEALGLREAKTALPSPPHPTARGKRRGKTATPTLPNHGELMQNIINESKVVPPPGVEPGRPFGPRILNSLRMPFRQGGVFPAL